MYYKDINGVVLVFDLTDEDSFRNINFWISDIEKHAPEKIVKILVGNKVDLAQIDSMKDSIDNRREVSYEAASNFALDNKMFYYECSAKTGENINEVFHKVAEEINITQKSQIEMSRESEIAPKGSILDSALNYRRSEEKPVRMDVNFNQKKSKCCQ